MEKSTATEIMASIQRVNACLNDLGELVRGAALSEEEKFVLLSGVGHMVGEIFFKLMHPLIRQHPEVDPDRDH